MNYNALFDIIDVTDESTGDEPVTVQEFKDYLRLEGYIDVDESTADDLSDFDFDDALIAKIIKKARIRVEKRHNVSLVAKTLQGTLTNLCGMAELLYPPIGDIVSLYDEDENEIESTDYKIIGSYKKFLKYPCYKNMVITYETLASDEDYSIEILREAAYMYENRGDDSRDKTITWSVI